MTFDLEDAKKRGCAYIGGPARIIASDLRGSYPIAAAVSYGEYEVVYMFTADGRCRDSSIETRLVNLPREVTVWAVTSERLLSYGGEADSRDWCERERSLGYAAGYAPVTIKLTR